jgi:hypothetical protein
MKLIANLILMLFSSIALSGWAQSNEVETHSSMNLPEIEIPEIPNVDSIVLHAMKLSDLKIEMDEKGHVMNIDMGEMMKELNEQLKELNIMLKEDLQIHIDHRSDCKEMPEVQRPRKVKKLRHRKGIQRHGKNLHKRGRKHWKHDAKHMGRARKY